MRQKVKQASDRLHAGLKALEAAAGAPIPPKGADAWLVAVTEAAAAFESAYQADLELHREVYRSVLAKSPELKIRVQELREREQRLHHRFRELVSRFDSAADLAGIQVDFQHWTADCRAHQAEVLNWFLESFYREYGGPA